MHALPCNAVGHKRKGKHIMMKPHLPERQRFGGEEEHHAGAVGQVEDCSVVGLSCCLALHEVLHRCVCGGGDEFN